MIFSGFTKFLLQWGHRWSQDNSLSLGEMSRSYSGTSQSAQFQNIDLLL